MVYVFDSSFVAALIIPDEWNPGVDEIKAGIGEEEEIFIPGLFWYEISNIFYNLVRRRRYTIDEVFRLFPNLSAIRLTGDHETGPGYSANLLRLCSDFNLSSYDAAYLELAKRKNAVLCTMDKSLRAAAKKCGVAVK